MIKVNGKELPWAEGLTVRQVLIHKGYTFPLLVVKLNGVSIPKDKYDTTLVQDGDQLQVIHLISGG